MDRGHVEARERGEGAHDVVLAVAGAERLDQRDHELLGLPHEDHVAERRERDRIREGERTAGDDQRVRVVPLGGEQGDVGEPEALEEPWDLELVGDRGGQDRVLPGRPLTLEGQELVRAIVLVRQDGAVRGHPRNPVENPVDGLVTE